MDDNNQRCEIEEYYTDNIARLVETSHVCNHNIDPKLSEVELGEMLKKFGSKFVHVPNVRIKTGSVTIVKGFVPSAQKCQPSTVSTCVNIDKSIIDAANDADSFDNATYFNDI